MLGKDQVFPTNNPLLLMAEQGWSGNDADKSTKMRYKPMRLVGQSCHPSVISHIRRRGVHDGFSLVELVVVVAIIGILAAISFPAYNQYLIRANKAAAKAVLMEVASRQEQYLMKAGKTTCSDPADPTDANQTPTCTYVIPSGGNLPALGYTVPAEVIRNFDITLTAGTNTTSTVVALQGLPTFTVSARGKAGTIQEGQPPTPLSINQFGLKLPVSEW